MLEDNHVHHPRWDALQTAGYLPLNASFSRATLRASFLVDALGGHYDLKLPKDKHQNKTTGPTPNDFRRFSSTSSGPSRGDEAERLMIQENEDGKTAAQQLEEPASSGG